MIGLALSNFSNNSCWISEAKHCTCLPLCVPHLMSALVRLLSVDSGLEPAALEVTGIHSKGFTRMGTKAVQSLKSLSHLTFCHFWHWLLTSQWFVPPNPVRRLPCMPASHKVCVTLGAGLCQLAKHPSGAFLLFWRHRQETQICPSKEGKVGHRS